MPRAPWVMTQTWRDLLFAHWPIDPGVLAPTIPAGLELDLFDGQAWIGVVPFRMSNVAPRVLPAVPWMSAFPELNVRTYVRLAGRGERPGVYFYSLDATSTLAVLGARAIFHLPYYWASMRVETRGDVVQYESRRRLRSGAQSMARPGAQRGAWPGARSASSPGVGRGTLPEVTSGGQHHEPATLRATYAPDGPVFRARDGTLEYFLTERYCLHTVRRGGEVLTVDIHHPPWPLQAARATFAINTMIEAAGITAGPDTDPAGRERAPVLHFAKRQDTVAWPPKRFTRPL